MEIAAAGGHNVIMVGPPGSGKTMIAKRFPSILPSFTFEEMIKIGNHKLIILIIFQKLFWKEQLNIIS